MKLKNKLIIKKSIDQLRSELYNIIEKENLDSKNILKISCKLDKLILQYYYKETVLMKPLKRLPLKRLTKCLLGKQGENHA